MTQSPRPAQKRPGKTRSSRHQNRPQHRQAIDHALTLMDAVCLIAGSGDLIGDRNDEPTQRLRAAITDHDTAFLFERLLDAFSMQGISNHAAFTYMERHGRVTWSDVEQALAHPGSCPKLKSHWSFHQCKYKKSTRTCSEPGYISGCPLPHHDLRNGRLNQLAYGLYLFIRDVADGDLIAWIDHQLRRATKGTVDVRWSGLSEQNLRVVGKWSLCPG